MPSPAGHHSPASVRELAVNRRGFLRTSLGASAGVLAAPTFAKPPRIRTTALVSGVWFAMRFVL